MDSPVSKPIAVPVYSDTPSVRMAMDIWLREHVVPFRPEKPKPVKVTFSGNYGFPIIHFRYAEDATAFKLKFQV